MATITSGVGLFSGLDYASLVEQLIAIEARPRDQLKVRMSQIDAQRTALMDISARVTSLLSRVKTLTKPATFRATTATSSNKDALSATSAENARPGTHNFIVRSLATTHQLVSRGFTSRTAPVGGGSFTIESTQARVNQDTRLEALNGYAGVQRGAFRVIDGDGEEAVVQINDAQTVNDVLTRINDAGIGVRAELRGEAIVLIDTTGGAGGVRVREEGSGHTAADLGFGMGNSFSASGELLGERLYYLSELTPLEALNDGLGVQRAKAGVDFEIEAADGTTVKVELSGIIKDSTRLERLNHGRGVDLGTIRITTRNGVATEVDLSEAETVGDVINKVKDQAPNVSVVMASGRLIITDGSSGDENNFKIEDVSGNAARDLGILGDTEKTKIDGREVLSVTNVGDVIAAINYGDGNVHTNGRPAIEAALDATGTRLEITDHSGGTFPATIFRAGPSGAKALEDLGFQEGTGGGGAISGARIFGGMNTVLLSSLNGGNGFETGTVRLAANGASADVDLTGAETLRDVVERLRAAAEENELGITIGYDSTGVRLFVQNEDDPTAAVTVSDVEGEFAAALGLAGSSSRLRGDNLQRQYLSGNTQLSTLNGGKGVSLGKFRISDSTGAGATVNLASAKTLQDVIDAINKLENIDVEASLNETGDGLLLTDTAGGSFALKVEEQGGSTARDLNLLGKPVEGKIDGSYEYQIEALPGESLDDVVKRINETNIASASLLNDGSPVAPYRLSITSLATGLAGELILDGDESGLDFATLTRAQNAEVIVGNTPESGFLVSSSTNTISDIVEGVTLNLSAVDDEPISITVSRDTEALIGALKGMVQDYNSAVKRARELSSYDAETETAGVLLGDSTVRILEDRLYRAFTNSVPGATGTLRRLSQVGVKVDSGAVLAFDETKFREMFEQDPEAVIEFFTAAETGLAVKLEEILKQTTEAGGLLKRRDSSLEDQKEMLQLRVTHLNALLGSKRERMLREFQAMEEALAKLQSQQQSLASFAASYGTATGTNR